MSATKLISVKELGNMKNKYETEVATLLYKFDLDFYARAHLDIKGPLKNKIYFGTAKEKRKEKPVKLSSLVYILKNNGFIRKNNPI
jgi:hypothetical protein